MCGRRGHGLATCSEVGRREGRYYENEFILEKSGFRSLLDLFCTGFSLDTTTVTRDDFVQVRELASNKLIVNVLVSSQSAVCSSFSAVTCRSIAVSTHGCSRRAVSWSRTVS